MMAVFSDEPEGVMVVEGFKTITSGSAASSSSAPATSAGRLVLGGGDEDFPATLGVHLDEVTYSLDKLVAMHKKLLGDAPRPRAAGGAVVQPPPSGPPPGGPPPQRCAAPVAAVCPLAEEPEAAGGGGAADGGGGRAPPVLGGEAGLLTTASPQRTMLSLPNKHRI